ncbi:hypothetical protein ABW20_dc0106959 [Dactylellina cionopaga]|nr:hypothetical protein ABW20_dc0106959 [Dactylellina cionopaga]
MNPRLCSLSTFINDLRAYLSRKSEDTSCGRDSFEALFGSLGDIIPDADDGIFNTSEEASILGGDVEVALEEVFLTPGSGTHDGREVDAEDNSIVFLPGTPTSLEAGNAGLSAPEVEMIEDITIDIATTASLEQRVLSEVDDLWKKIFEDLDPEEIEPEGALKKAGVEGADYHLDGSEDITALERLIRKSEVFT